MAVSWNYAEQLVVMMVTLRDHLVIFDVPLRVLWVRITKESDGSELKILHWSAQEFDSVQLVSRQPISNGERRPICNAEHDSSHEDDGTSGMPLEFVADIAPLREIDVSRIPPQYRTVPEEAARDFAFERGATYSVSVVGDRYVDSTVTAK